MALPGLSLARGEQMQREIFARCGRPVTSSLSSYSFALVVAFGRCKHRLDCDSVSCMLQATLGGDAKLFHVSHLSKRSFKFFVSSKTVGFLIVNLRSFECNDFFFTLHLWSNGGPNWRREFSLFQMEEANSWQAVRTKRSASAPNIPATNSFVQAGKSFADATRNPSCTTPLPTSAPFTADHPLLLSGANAVIIGSAHSAADLLAAGGGAPPLTGANAIPVKQVGPHAEGSTIFKRGQPSNPPADQTGKSFGDPADAATMTPYCPRCLMNGHDRAACFRPIRCLQCLGWGHIAVSFVHPAAVKGKHGADNSKKRPPNQQRPDCFFLATGAAACGPSASSPPRFKSFNEMAAALALKGTWAAKKTVNELNDRCARVVEEPNTIPSITPLDPLTLSLVPPSSTLLSPSSRENPSPVLQCNLQAALDGESLPATMAYQRADPRPFTPDNFQWIDIPGRVYMCRAVAPSRPPANNEDLTIVTIDPLPGNALNFGAVDNMVRQFLFQRGMHPRGGLSLFHGSGLCQV